MDYLDPRKRRAHNIRLIVGYVLVAIVIGLATYILVAGANGYGFNVKTGQIVQNALLFTDSDPSNAEIYLNGQDKHTTTPARLVLPAGNYTLKLTKSGYRDWSRQFTLNEQSVARYVYPFLFPVKPITTDLKTYPSQPGLVTQTPDRRWLLIESPQASTQVPTFDEYDTSTLDKTTPSVQQVAMPADLLTNYSPNDSLTLVEWSTDNNNVLLEHAYNGGNEFVVFNRVHPDQSFNVNRMFNVVPTQVNLFNKKSSQLYIYRQDTQNLQVGDTGSKILASPVLKHVLAYKPYGSTLITYVTDNNEPKGMVDARIWNDGPTYKLDEFPAGNTYLVDAAQYAGDFYYAAGSDTSGRVNIYKNPLNELQGSSGQALPLIALNLSGAQKMAFSDNARFLEAQNGQDFAVYDFETQSYYQYSVSDPLADNLTWMDGHRLMGESGGKIFVMDYDGTNKQFLTATSQTDGGLFNTPYVYLLNIAPSADGSSFVLQAVDMRAGVDLPKNKQPSS